MNHTEAHTSSFLNLRNLFRATFSFALLVMLSTCGRTTTVEDVVDSSNIYTGNGVLSWSTPTQYTDGSPLTVSKYHVYYATSSGAYDSTVYYSVPAPLSSPTVSVAVKDFNLPKQQYFFVITAFDASDVESDFSNEASAELTSP